MQDTTFLCLASQYKGGPFLEAAHALGCHVVLLTRPELRQENWPHHAIREILYLPSLKHRREVLQAVDRLARHCPIDRVVALDERDGEMAASLREHMGLGGLGESAIRRFRDKLTMRELARQAGVEAPDFVHVLNHGRVHRFTQAVPPPWVLKPRAQAGSLGIKLVRSAAELWELVHRLGDEQSHYLLEKFVAGDVFHVDSVVFGGRILFAQAHRYGTPPFSLWNYGGVFTTRSLGEPDELLRLNERVIQGLGLSEGVSHNEFIRDSGTGRYHFLELAARVGGAHIDVLVEKCTGVQLWREWARLELACLRGTPYAPPRRANREGALLICLARQEHPDLSAYADPEVVWTLPKRHHAGLVVASSDGPRIDRLAREFAERMARDFLAVVPPLETARH